MADSNNNRISRKLKYPERFREWQQFAGFNERQIIATVGQLHTVRYQIDVEDIELDGIRLLFFADLHCGIHFSRLLSKALIQSINQAEADIVICGGDLLARSFDQQLTKDILSACRAKSSKIAVLGNWECYDKSKLDADAWREFYQQCGFTLLRNQSMSRNKLNFYGIDDIKTGMLVFSSSTGQGYNILLSHNPDTVIHIADDTNLAHFDVALCGHTHAGQLRIPLFGALASSSRYGRKFDCGHFMHRRFTDVNMFISAGIGTSAFPWRLNCPPEIMVIDLVTKTDNKRRLP
ncbi:MAG: metallophosphoesterase [Victivallaceae bacterium]|nr:metallophosphoesterase [Victivallaceae bacterium]